MLALRTKSDSIQSDTSVAVPESIASSKHPNAISKKSTRSDRRRQQQRVAKHADAAAQRAIMLAAQRIAKRAQQKSQPKGPASMKRPEISKSSIANDSLKADSASVLDANEENSVHNDVEKGEPAKKPDIDADELAKNHAKTKSKPKKEPENDTMISKTTPQTTKSTKQRKKSAEPKSEKSSKKEALPEEGRKYRLTQSLSRKTPVANIPDVEGFASLKKAIGLKASKFKASIELSDASKLEILRKQSLMVTTTVLTSCSGQSRSTPSPKFSLWTRESIIQVCP